MPSFTTPLEAIVSKLRSSGVDGIEWGTTVAGVTTGNPYYIVLPEGDLNRTDLYPYVVIDIPDSTTEYVFQGTNQYLETINPIIRVVALEPDIQTLSSPYGEVDTSVIRYLDSLIDSYTQFSGENYDCISWTRKSYRLEYDTSSRSPGGGRVWIGTANYEMKIEASYGS